jgi:outer membrane protein with beta-barrel domain
MRKLLFATIMVACAASYGWAQSNDNYNKAEFAGGYSLAWLDDGTGDRERFNGLFVEGTGNFTRYVGIKGEYSWHRKDFGAGLNANIHTFVGGVQVKDNSTETVVKPFAHAMAGFANARASFAGTGDSSTGFAGVFGGGLDLRASRHIDVRVIQADYVPTHIEGETQHNFRIGFGIVLH